MMTLLKSSNVGDACSPIINSCFGGIKWCKKRVKAGIEADPKAISFSIDESSSGLQSAIPEKNMEQATLARIQIPSKMLVSLFGCARTTTSAWVHLANLQSFDHFASAKAVAK